MSGAHTIVGADGFIGSHLAVALETAGEQVRRVTRGDPLPSGALGTVYHCAGVTADFRTRPRDTVTAHVCTLVDLLWETDHEALVYCSSTRVYQGAESGREDARLGARPDDPSDLYNLSKMLGEAACLAAPGGRARVARIANVVGGDPGSENFLFALARESLTTGAVRLRQPGDAARDYIAIGDVVRLLPLIAHGRERIYNVASGRSLSNLQIADAVAAATGFPVVLEASEPALAFPPIDHSRVRREFGFEPADVLALLPELVNAFHRGSAR